MAIAMEGTEHQQVRFPQTIFSRGKRDAVCGKQLTFLYTNPYEHVEYKVSQFQVLRLRLSTFFLNNTCSDIILFTIIFVIKSR